MLVTPDPKDGHDGEPRSPAPGRHEPLLNHKGSAMAHFKLHDDDTSFLDVPQGAVMVSSGISGTETFIERAQDATVRIVMQTVAIATGDNATLEACLEINGGAAKGEDGPMPNESHLKAMQSVQVVVKQGERLNFKAYPQATNAKVLRTVVYTADQKAGG
jgi:hypothetical protein